MFAWKKAFMIFLICLAILCAILDSVNAFVEIKTDNKDINTGVPVDLKFLIRTVQVGGTGIDSNLRIVSDDWRVIFDNCAGDKIINTSLPPTGIKNYKTKAVFFEPRRYYLTYIFNLSNGTSYIDTLYIDASGFSYDPLNATKNYSYCINQTFIPSRRQQYGFDPKKNIVLERLNNKTVPIIKNNSIISNISINNTENVSINETIIENSFKFKKFNVTINENDLELENFYIPTLGTEIFIFIIVSIIMAIICVFFYFTIGRDEER